MNLKVVVVYRDNHTICMYTCTYICIYVYSGVAASGASSRHGGSGPVHVHVHHACEEAAGGRSGCLESSQESRRPLQQGSPSLQLSPEGLAIGSAPVAGLSGEASQLVSATVPPVPGRLCRPYLQLGRLVVGAGLNSYRLTVKTLNLSRASTASALLAAPRAFCSFPPLPSRANGQCITLCK